MTMASTTLSKPVFKPLRKGTRSCQECRRRKIKCKFANEEDIVCEPCKRYDRDCLKQGYFVDKTLKARVLRAESTAERMLRWTEKASGAEPSISTTRTQQEALPSAFELPAEKSQSGTGSFLQLFDAKPLTNGHQSAVPAPQLQTMVTFHDPNLTDLDKLLSSISNEPSVSDVLEPTSSWWTQWRDQGWSQRRSTSSQTLMAIVKNKLSSEDPASVAVGLTCLAMSLFVFRPGIDDVGQKVRISTSPKDLMQRILAVVDTVVLGTQKYDEHEDIILVTMLRGKLYSEDSQARKGSQKLQQALQIMQRRRFGIKAQPGMTSEDLHAQQQFLGSVYEVERFMCMVFGFPYMPDPNFSDRLAFQLLNEEHENVPLSLRMRAMRRVAAIAAERVNDRNAQKRSDSAEVTNDIAQRLMIAHDALPPEWWNPQLIAQGDDYLEAFEILLSQVWFWTTKMFLFLPAVLDNPCLDSRHPSSQYTQCLDAARNLIRAFLALRGTPAISVQVCNCDDFMGILAASVLLVALMQAASSSDLEAREVETTIQFEQDIELIDSLKDVYRYRSFEQGGTIAKQGLKVLETLSSFFDEPDTSDLGAVGGSDHAMGADQPATTAIMLPYFGTIYVQSSRKLVKPQFTARSHQLLPTPPASLFNELVPDESAFNMVDWDDWNQFMFDTELNKDWNEDLASFGTAQY